MILISAIKNSIVISSDQIINKGVIEVGKKDTHKSKIVSVSGTNFIRIPVKEKGRYKVKVTLSEQYYSKTVNVF